MVFGSDSVKLGRQRCKVETVETVEEFRRQRARFWCGLREQFYFRLNPPDMPDAEQFAEPAQMVERGNRQGRRLQREEGPAYGAGKRFGLPSQTKLLPNTINHRIHCDGLHQEHV